MPANSFWSQLCLFKSHLCNLLTLFSQFVFVFASQFLLVTAVSFQITSLQSFNAFFSHFLLIVNFANCACLPAFSMIQLCKSKMANLSISSYCRREAADFKLCIFFANLCILNFENFIISLLQGWSRIG